MGCSCGGGNYLPCYETDKTIKLEAGSMAESGAADFKHIYEHEVLASNLPFKVLESTKRTFSVTHSHSISAEGTPQYAIACPDGTHEVCSEGRASASRSYNATVSENCVREINTLYYLDRLNGICVYRNTRESLVFNVTSSKSADFKVKWGTATYNKVCLPKSIGTLGTEKFVLVRNGVETVLAETSYSYNPFPVYDTGGGTWGLYGGVTKGSEYETPDVALILIFPLVGKQAMPLDKDVQYYSFYDYNAMEGGFIENSLSRDDGGKDYFYPYWCRQMPVDALWRSTADKRYEVIYQGSPATFGAYGSGQYGDISGSAPWSIGVPETVYALPFGSFAVDSQEAFVYSCLCQFSDRAGGAGVVVNYSSFGDLYKAIYTDNKIAAGKFNDLYPVAPL